MQEKEQPPSPEKKKEKGKPGRKPKSTLLIPDPASSIADQVKHYESQLLADEAAKQVEPIQDDEDNEADTSDEEKKAYSEVADILDQTPPRSTIVVQESNRAISSSSYDPPTPSLKQNAAIDWESETLPEINTKEKLAKYPELLAKYEASQKSLHALMARTDGILQNFYKQFDEARLEGDLAGSIEGFETEIQNIVKSSNMELENMLGEETPIKKQKVEEAKQKYRDYYKKRAKTLAQNEPFILATKKAVENRLANMKKQMEEVVVDINNETPAAMKKLKEQRIKTRGLFTFEKSKTKRAVVARNSQTPIESDEEED